MRLLACLIVAPQRGYDEPAILSYAISSFCPTSADGLQDQNMAMPSEVLPEPVGPTSIARDVVVRMLPRRDRRAESSALATKLGSTAALPPRPRPPLLEGQRIREARPLLRHFRQRRTLLLHLLRYSIHSRLPGHVRGHWSLLLLVLSAVRYYMTS